MNYSLLLVNQDQEFIDNFIYSFKTEDYAIDYRKNIKEAIEAFRAKEYDLVIIDMQYKDGTGLDLKRKLNEIRSTATIVVSESNEPNDKVLALEYGCDDYIVRPFYLLELKARMRAVLRRTSHEEKAYEPAPQQDALNKGFFEFNILGRKVKVDEHELDLTGKEFDLLYILVSNKKRIFSRRDLADQLWKDIDQSNIRTIDVHIRRLREKLEPTRASEFIQTSWGQGYYFDDTVENKRR